MKRNVIAILLSISLISGSFGPVPLYAAEVTTQETEQVNEEKGDEDKENLFDTAEGSTEEDLGASDNESNDVGEDNQKDNAGASSEDDTSLVQDQNDESEENSLTEDATVAETTREVTENEQEALAVEDEQIVDKSLSESKSREIEATSVTSTIFGTGYCGKNGDDLTWTVYGDGILEISGTGEMADYSISYAPWRSLRNVITEIVVCDDVTRIGNYAFYELENCNTLTISDSVSSVGESVFPYCHINSVYFDGSMSQWINKSQFSLFYAYNLYIKDGQDYALVTNLTGLEGVQSIPSLAFSQCKSLTSIDIPDSVTSIGDSAFSGCKWLTEIVLPNSLKEIGSGAFTGCEGIQSIELPDSVITIESYAFNGCKVLQSIELPDSVTTIERYAFGDCEALQSIELSDSVTSIGNNAFYGCKSLQSVVITDNVTTIGDSAFYNCPSMTSIQFPEAVTLGNNVIDINTVQEIRGYDGSDIYREFVINKKSNAKYNWISLGKATKGKCGDDIDWNLKNGILSLVGTGDMYNGELWKDYDVDYVLISEGITGIGERSFSGLNMEEVQLPDTITSIGEYAFLYCNSLKSVYLPDQIKEISEGAFWACNKLETIVLPESLEVISGYAFLQCGIASIEIPDSVTRIEGSAFNGCTNLKEISLSDSLEYLGDGAFGNTKLSSIELPDSITYIGEKCFEYCTNLTEIEIPSSVEEIGDRAFYWTSITKVYYKGTIDEFVNSRITYSTLERDYYGQISTYVYLYCLGDDGEYYLVEDIELSEDVTGIPSGKFSGCLQIKTVNLSSNLKTIASNAFSGCNSLSDIIIPEGVESLGYGAFAYCNNLSRIKLPASLETIEDQQFNSDTITLVVYEDSIAHKYAVDNDLNYEINTEEIKAESVTLSEQEITIEKGKSIQLTVEILPTSTLNKTLEWTTSNKSIAYVTKSGVVVGVNEGIATITVSTANGKTDSCEVAVVNDIPLTGISLPESIEIAYGQEFSVLLEYEPSTATDDKTASWQTSDPTILIVSEDGTITPTGIGTTTLTATVGEFSATSEISVIKGTPEYEMPEAIDAVCGQVLSELTLPEGFEWDDPEQGVGNAGSNSFIVSYTPEDTDHYITVGNIAVVVNVSHEYAEEWAEGDDAHWHECACGEKVDETEHIYGEWEVTTEPTCTESGEKQRICTECGHVDKDTIASKGHDWFADYTVDAEATCVDAGEKSIYCKDCGEKKEGSTVDIPPLGHIYAEKVFHPTCSQGGFTMHICGRCEDYYEDNETQPTGHTFTDWIIDHDSTCTEEGIQHRECEDCGYIETKGINKKEHSFDTEFTVDREPTCTTDGSKSFHCISEGCTATTGSEVIPANGHDYGDWTVTKEATCTESGEMQRTCSVCDETETVEFGAKGHVWLKDYMVDQAPTCTEEGSESIHCAACDAVKEGTSRPIPVSVHNYGEWTVTLEPTCTEEGSREKVCEDCNHTVVEPVRPLGHHWGDEFTVDRAATCSEEGSESIHCTACGVICVSTVHTIPKEAHVFSPWTTTEVATCTEPGEMQRTCAVCGENEIVEFGARGHVWLKDYMVDQPATCTEAGSESIHCAACDAVKEESEREIPSAGHTLTHVEAVAATYESEGNIEYYSCGICGKLFKDESCEQEITADETVIPQLEGVPLAIVTHPADVKVKAGETATFRVVAEGNNLSYRWQWSTDGNTWKNSTAAGYDTDTFSFKMSTKYAGRYYRCKVTDGIDTVYSESGLLSVAETLKIIKDPADVAAKAGDTVTFTVAAQGSNLSYRWQWSTDGSIWKNSTAAGYNTDAFSFKMSTKYAGRYYRCKVSDGNDTVYSKGGLLSLADTIQVISEPADVSARAGEDAVFTVEATGNNLSYQWQWSKDEITWKNSTAAGYNTDTFSFTMNAKYAGRYYRCKITNGTDTVYTRGGLLSVTTE